MSTKIPRMEFAELPDSIASLLKSKYERLGYLGEFFARTAHQEEALKMMVMARYIGHAVLVNSMNIEAPVSSIFDDGAGFVDEESA